VIIFGALGEPDKGLLMGANWVINLAVAEWLLCRKLSKGRKTHVDTGRDQSQARLTGKL
jgi:hypothetical protein